MKTLALILCSLAVLQAHANCYKNGYYYDIGTQIENKICSDKPYTLIIDELEYQVKSDEKIIAVFTNENEEHPILNESELEKYALDFKGLFLKRKGEKTKTYLSNSKEFYPIKVSRPWVIK